MGLPRARSGLVATVLALAITAVVAARRSRPHAAEVAVPPRERTGYASSDTCRGCHPEQHASWHRTYHRTMTQPASPSAVLARFDGRTLRLGATEHRLRSDGEGFWIDGPGGARRIEMTTGAHHMQVYWARGPGDVLESIPFAYLVDRAQWVPNEHTLLRPDRGAVPYTWNRVCIKCHAVAGNPGLDAGTGTVSTTVAELGIACEACHGPARDHVERNHDPVRRYLSHLGVRADPSIVDPSELDAAEVNALCGRCHGVTVWRDEASWLRHGSGHAHGADDDLRLVRHPLRADQPWMDEVLAYEPDYFETRYWNDGMVRVTGREWGAVVDSPCNEGGLSCLSCHSMHGGAPDDQLDPARPGDRACLQCHAIDGPAHAHHDADSEGSRCLGCHMPPTTYGLLKAVASHQIDVPDVEVSLATGRPNACNVCHLDRTLAWTAERLNAWYGRPEPAGLEREPAAAAVVHALAGDAGQRALAADHLARPSAIAVAGRRWQIPILARLLLDPYPAVRLVAERSLDRLLGRAPTEPWPTDRERAFELAMGALSAQGGPDRFGPAVLVHADGSLDREAHARLLARRDDRPVVLEE